MPDITLEQKVDLLTGSVADIANAMSKMALQVYKNTHEDDDDEDEIQMAMPGMSEVDPNMGGEMPGVRPPMPGEEDLEMGHGMGYADPAMDPAMNPALNPGMGGEVPPIPGEEEMEMMGQPAYKGYANTAQQTANEEDAPFGEQQNNVRGNEPSPAGEMGGGREDETFNVSFASYLADMRFITAELQKSGGRRTQPVQGLQTTQSPVPGLAPISKGRGGTEFVMTPEMEVQVKSRSYRQINALREQTGNLPRHALIG